MNTVKLQKWFWVYPVQYCVSGRTFLYFGWTIPLRVFLCVCECVLRSHSQKNLLPALRSLLCVLRVFSEAHKSRFPQHNARFTRSVLEIPPLLTGNLGFSSSCADRFPPPFTHVQSLVSFLRSQSYQTVQRLCSLRLKTVQASVLADIMQLVEDYFGGF